MRLVQALCLLTLAIGCSSAVAAGATGRLTIQARSCLGWEASLHRMLHWSEAYAIHPPELRALVRGEADKLKGRCLRDISQASVNRYVLLTKMLFDDEADEVEGFD